MCCVKSTTVKKNKFILGKSDKVLVIRVDVGELDVRVDEQLILADTLTLTQLHVDDSLRLFAQSWIPGHLIESNQLVMHWLIDKLMKQHFFLKKALKITRSERIS